MEKALEKLYETYTGLELTEIAFFIAKHQLEILHIERNLIKHTLPLNEEKFQSNTDIINLCAEATMSLEEMLRKQKKD